MSAATALALRKASSGAFRATPSTSITHSPARAPSAQAGSHRELVLSDGRTLAWRQYGAENARPLYVMHGFPSCGLLAALLHEQAASAAITLIAPDRPGFGHSTPVPGRRIADWPLDVASLAAHLGHERFGVLGVSCGGPYALVCAAALPRQVAHASLMGGIGPMNLPGLRRAQLMPLKVLFALARLHPSLASPILFADAQLFSRRPEQAMDALKGLLSAPDQRALRAGSAVRGQFIASFLGAYRQGIAGAMAEAALIARPHGIDLSAIHRPVHVYQGALDRHVPVEMGRHIAAALPDGRLHLSDEDGHLSIVLSAFADCAAQFHADWVGDPKQ